MKKINKGENLLANGMVSMTLDYRHNGIRVQKRLPGILYKKYPKTKEEKEHKKAMEKVIDHIIAKMQIDELYQDFMLDSGFNLTKDFFEYADEFMDRKANKSEIRTYKAVTKSFKEWGKKEKLSCGSITESMMIKFKDFLEAKHKGISAYNYFKKLKRIFKEATLEKHFKINPVLNILNNKSKTAEKDTLTIEEVTKLNNTSCSNEIVKRAFLFCCLTGLRFCDVKLLKWKHIKGGWIDISQVKTKERLVKPLRADTLKLIGGTQDSENLIFKLPSHTGCLKQLKKWTKDAEINKHITWHCARHSLATNLFEKHVDPYTISKLLGHKNIIQTQTYMRVSDQRKITAMDAIPQLS